MFDGPALGGIPHIHVATSLSPVSVESAYHDHTAKCGPYHQQLGQLLMQHRLSYALPAGSPREPHLPY